LFTTDRCWSDTERFDSLKCTTGRRFPGTFRIAAIIKTGEVLKMSGFSNWLHDEVHIQDSAKHAAPWVR
jgi:hypothetical protein